MLLSFKSYKKVQRGITNKKDTLYMMSCFSIDVFKILSLCFAFENWTIMCLSVVSTFNLLGVH